MGKVSDYMKYRAAVAQQETHALEALEAWLDVGRPPTTRKVDWLDQCIAAPTQKAPHSQYTASIELLRRAAKWVKERDFGGQE